MLAFFKVKFWHSLQKLANEWMGISCLGYNLQVKGDTGERYKLMQIEQLFVVDS